MLSMESTSTRMTRLGRSVITDTELLSPERIIAEIEAVEPDAVSELASILLASDRLSIAGIGPDEDHFNAAAGAISPVLARRSAA
jgi:predicted Zn-dependent peptidase